MIVENESSLSVMISVGVEDRMWRVEGANHQGSPSQEFEQGWTRAMDESNGLELIMLRWREKQRGRGRERERERVKNKDEYR